MKRSRSGMAVLELVVALAAAGIIATAGMRAFAGIGEYLQRRNLREGEAMALSGLENRFGRSWDHRLAHSFAEAPWLIVEGMPVAGGTKLIRVRMRIVGREGQVSWWELAWTGTDWTERVSAEAAPDSDPVLIRIRYSGSIQLDIGPGEWFPGDGPSMIRWGFPDARFHENQIGFAVWDIWQ